MRSDDYSGSLRASHRRSEQSLLPDQYGKPIYATHAQVPGGTVVLRVPIAVRFCPIF